MDAVAIIAILIAMVLLGAGKAPNTNNTPSDKQTGSWSETVSNRGSIHAESISIGRGNARNTYQSYEEYITLDNRGDDSIDITGWQLRNAKDERAYDTTGTLRFFPADTAVIPQATILLSPYGTNFFQNVILKEGEKAIITTGKIGSQSPYKIVSFKENICTGYIEKLDEYKFTPPLSRHCPRPADEPGIATLDVECRKTIERMSLCHTPEFDTRDDEGDICRNCIDEKPVSRACVAFAKAHFNYAGCIANHAGRTDFQEDTWRIFLGRGWEMWAEDYESIRLYDILGRLVSERSY